MRQLIIILTLIIALTASGQGLTDNMTIGLNLPPIAGNTLDLKIESNPRPHWTHQLATGVMINNKIPGSLLKKGDFTRDWVNSGAFASLGVRFNTRKQINKSTYFIGSKLIGGYFDQSGTSNWDNTNQAIRETGLFAAVGLETGATIKFTDRFHLDIGFQYSLPFYTDKQVSGLFSVLPGIGAIMNLQGIVTPKFYIGRRKKE